jgi:hypothetical protein
MSIDEEEVELSVVVRFVRVQVPPFRHCASLVQKDEDSKISAEDGLCFWLVLTFPENEDEAWTCWKPTALKTIRTSRNCIERRHPEPVLRL